jgi:SNF2 family DNA or RNA helicase
MSRRKTGPVTLLPPPVMVLDALSAPKVSYKFMNKIPSLASQNIEDTTVTHSHKNTPFNYDTVLEFIKKNPGRLFIDENHKRIQTIDFSDYHTINNRQFDDKKREFMSLLDEKSQKIPADIDGIHTTLTEFQRTAVAAMLEIEEKRGASFSEGTRDTTGVINTSAAVYSDEVGSGKTISSLALIRIKPYPYRLDSGFRIDTCQDLRPIYVDNVKDQIHHSKKHDDTGFRGFIKRTYKNILRPTIVFAGVSVAKQWSDAIETFTNFKSLEIVDVKGMDQLMKMIENGSINEYDIVIVKNGTVTRDVNLPGNLIKEDKNKISSPYIYNLIGNLRNIAWSRCIIDDFDNIQLPPNASIINALFTWYISSTTKIIPCGNLHNNQFTKTSEVLTYDNVSCGSILRNQFLFTMFNVRNDHGFIQKYNGLTKPIFYVGVFKDVNDKFTGLIDSFSNEETNELVQMLNSGSINTAAEKAGVASKSAGDIFEKILEKNYALYRKSVNVIKFIDRYYDDDTRLGAIQIPEDPEDDDHTYNKEHLFRLKVPMYKYPNLRTLMKETREEQEKIRTTTDAALRRVKENIKSGNCPICTSSIQEIDGNIMICKKCNVTGCEDCITLACSFYPVDNTVKGRCPMCRKEILITDMIHVSKDIELQDIVNDNFEGSTKVEQVLPEIKTEEKVPEYIPIDEHDTNDPEARTKISALIDVIQGRMPIEFKRADIYLNQLQSGEEKIIESPHPYRKILVFTSYEESIDNISKALNLRNIAFWRLAGTAANINLISKKFNSYQGNSVLIINSSKHCAGLNLQSADWLIYFHKVLNTNIETQIAGRGQRLGRKSTLKIGYLLHPNEISHINFI